MKSNTITMNMSSSAMTGTDTITSDAIPVDQLWGFAIQAVWTGTPNGQLKLQASCDAPLRAGQVSDGDSNVTNWVDVSDSFYTVSGTAGNYMWNFASVGFRFVRLSYTNVSGTGELSAVLCAKGV